MLDRKAWKAAGRGAMLSLALLGFVPLASAQSADTKGYSAIMCQPGGSGLSVNYSTNAVYPNSSGWLYCPAAKDRHGSEASSQTAYVHVRDSNVSHNISCTFTLRDPFGGQADWASDGTSGTPGDDQLVMSVETGAADAFSTYLIACAFPTAGSASLSLASYSIHELNTNN